MTSLPDTLKAIILAGGTSTRMGSPKALLDWKGTPLWLHIVRIISPLPAKTMIVGFPKDPTSQDLTHAAFQEDPLGIGPLGGLATGLKGIDSSKAFVMACDMPFVTRKAILELWKKSDGFDVVIPKTSDGFHPLFAVYSRDCLPAIEKALRAGQRHLRSFFPGLKILEIPISDEDREWKKVLFNINTPDDFARALDQDEISP